jgi:hypothetical protein
LLSIWSTGQVLHHCTTHIYRYPQALRSCYRFASDNREHQSNTRVDREER